MSRVVSILKTLRSHWKKSTFAFCAISYGVNFGRDKYLTNMMMRDYCKEALTYGTIPISRDEPRRVTVILNPAAKKKKAKKLFEKYCAPLLYLAGMYVSVVQTDAEGQTRGLMEVMSNADAVIIAGGDGSLSEAVTGLLRREDSGEVAPKLPMGVLPLGHTNTVAKTLFGSEIHEAKFLATATMAVIRGSTKPVDVMKLEVSQQDKEGGSNMKPVFALGEVLWGAYRDAQKLRDKYWYWGSLRGYAAAVFCWPKSELSWNCQADLSYIAPCSGCKKCLGQHLQSADQRPKSVAHSRWWQAFMPRVTPPQNAARVDYSKITNDDCGIVHKRQISTTDLSIASSNAHQQPETCKPEVQSPSLSISFGPAVDDLTFTAFVSELWHRDDGNAPRFDNSVVARELWLHPATTEAPVETENPENKKSSQERWISIDQEDFELKSLHITLLPKSVRLFCSAT